MFPVPARPIRGRYLFLQGPASPFFSQLAKKLRANGQKVFRINLCLGDQMFWQGPAANYRGSLENWPAYLREFLTEESITDIILFGDCRPYHRIAVELAAARNVTVHVFEDGYLRPNWITVERGGVNGFSSLTRDPKVIRKRAAETEIPQPINLPPGMTHRVFWDILFNVAMVFGRPLFPGYQRHRTYHPFMEYAGWIRRLSRFRSARKHAATEIARLLAHKGGFYLVPLQLDDDYQIRKHSSFGNNYRFLRKTIDSFARCAPENAQLLVKVHPLDNGLIRRRKQIGKLAAEFGVADRVSCIDGGFLPTLLDAAKGVVLVNSTTGTSAIYHGCPTIALGTAIYAMPGLTFQGDLDDFWSDGTKPDAELFAAFYNQTVADTQIAGTLYTPDGIKHSVEGAAKRLCPVSAPPEAIRIFGEQLDLSVWPFSAKAAELIGPATMNDNAKPASSSAKRL